MSTPTTSEEFSTPIIKKRTKGIKSSSSTSSLRSIVNARSSNDDESASASTSTLNSSTPVKLTSTVAGQNGEEEDEGTTVVFRRKKGTPAGAGASRGIGSLGASTKVKKPTSRLSFGVGVSGQDDDDEGEDGQTSFVVKRSNDTSTPKRKLLSLKNPLAPTTIALPSNLDQASISTPPTTYSNEYLNELKSSTLSKDRSAPSNLPVEPTQGYDQLTMSKFGHQVQGDEDFNFPTTSAIASAKAKRQTLRQNPDSQPSTSSDYISLTVGAPSTSSKNESRLVREDDEDEMDQFVEDSSETLVLGKKAKSEAKRKTREGMIEMIEHGEDDDDDEESKEWEEMQIRRANEMRRQEEKTESKAVYKPTPIPQTTPLPTLSSVQNRLESGLNTLQSSHTLDSSALAHFDRERAELDQQEKELRGEVMRVEEKNRWFNEFRDFIEDVANFLDEKFPALEKIENENLAIQKERYEIVAKRRFEDDSDDVALFTGANVISRFGATTEQEDVEEEAQEEEPEVDELGRSRRRGDFEAGPRSGLRIARRTARDRRLGEKRSKLTNGDADEEALMWTDDELIQADSDDLADALSSLQELRTKLFEDVKVDDFRDPNLKIRRKFEEWRSEYREDYENAFGGLALVGVYEFWARVEMALWNPFEIDQLARTPSGLDSYHWHLNLTSFGHGSAHKSSEDMDQDQENDAPADESTEVVNALVTSVVIPRLAALARASYDPFSRRQTARALALVDEVSYCVETTSPKFESLIQAFFSRLQLCVSHSAALIGPHLEQISLPANAFDPSAFLARQRFLSRQLKLIQNAQKWRRYARLHRLPTKEGEVGSGCSFDELIQRELVAKIVLPIVEISWGSGGQEIGARIVKALPKDIPPALVRRLLGEQT